VAQNNQAGVITQLATVLVLGVKIILPTQLATVLVLGLKIIPAMAMAMVIGKQLRNLVVFAEFFQSFCF
jgi:small basic protein